MRLCDDIIVLRDGQVVGSAPPRPSMTIDRHDHADGRADHRPALSRRAQPAPRPARPCSRSRGLTPARASSRTSRFGAAARRGPGRLRPDGLGPLRARAHPLRPRPLRARRRSASTASRSTEPDAPGGAWTAAWPSSPRTAAVEGLMMEAAIADNIALPRCRTSRAGLARLIERTRLGERVEAVGRDVQIGAARLRPDAGQEPLRRQPAEGGDRQVAAARPARSSSSTSRRAASTSAPSTRSTR